MTDCQAQLSWSTPQAAQLLLFSLGGSVQLPAFTLIAQRGLGEPSPSPDPFAPTASKQKLSCTAGLFAAPGGEYTSGSCLTAETESQKGL